MVQLNFNAAQVEPAAGIKVLPSGVYDVIINNSEMKETKSKAAGQSQKGAYIQFNMRVASGEHNGSVIIARVNFENDNPTAEEIGQAELSAICRVCGVMQLQDTQQLHGIPFKVTLAKVERNDKPGEYGNEVKGYMDINGNGPDQAGQAPAAPPANTAPQPAPVAQPAPTPQPAQQPAQTAPQPAPAPVAPPAPEQPVAQPAPPPGALAGEAVPQPAAQPAPAPAPAAPQPPAEQATGAAVPPWERNQS